jgi:hypothetical protein
MVTSICWSDILPVCALEDVVLWCEGCRRLRCRMSSQKAHPLPRWKVRKAKKSRWVSAKLWSPAPGRTIFRKNLSLVRASSLPLPSRGLSIDELKLFGTEL